MKKELYAHFSLWFREIHSGETLPKSKKVYDFMDKEIKQKYGMHGWPCIRFKKNNIEEKEKINDLDM